MIRFVDILLALIILLLFLPLWIAVGILVSLDSPGGALFRQDRVGKKGQSFKLLKFRTMRSDTEKHGLLTIGASDARITRVGTILRKYKLDEIPQLINVLKREMSFVGPRPEVLKYVALYTTEQRKVLDVLPGITDYASIEYFEENRLLAESAEPERTYIEVVMPAKIKLNMKYIDNPTLLNYFNVLALTVKRIAR